MSVPLFTFIACLTLFVTAVVVIAVEESKARRLVGGLARNWLDERVLILGRRVSTAWHHFTQYIVKLGWYYGIHSLLATILRVLVSVYDKIEALFEKNRRRTKELRREFKKHLKQSHLVEIAHHKKETALTPEEQVALRHKKLQDDH